MSSCSSNSSNLLGNVNINDISGSGARLLMTVPLSGFSGGRRSEYVGDDGITAGDAIRYDNDTTSNSFEKYIKAQADGPANSEVVGIIEDISEGSGGIATIVLLGQINYPATKLIAATHIHPDAGVTGSAGGNDVYFLSAATAGVIQNLAPTEPTQVIKPVYQIAPDTPFTGQVVNYIGYQAGGQVVAEDFRQLPYGTIADVPDYSGKGDLTPGEGWVPFGSKLNLNPSLGDTYYASYAELGFISKTITRCYLNEAPTSTIVKQTISVLEGGAKKLTNGKIVAVSASNKYIDVEWTSSNFSNIRGYLTSGRTLNLNTGKVFSLVSGNAFDFVSFTLPTVDSTNTVTDVTFNIDGKASKFNIKNYTYSPADIIAGDETSGAKTHAVAIPQEIIAKKVTIEELITENSNVKISDIANAISAINDKVATLEDKVHGASSTSVSQIEKK